MDPINNAKIAIETPKPDGEFNIPEPPAAETSPVAVPEDSPIAPVVPIAIVPVNAGENNTSSSETPAVAITPSVAPEGPVTGLMTEPEASLAPDSELVERPSTHMPLLSAVPPPVDTPQTPAPPVGVPSVSEIPAETVTASESKTSETLAPSEPPVNPTPEPATTAASVSEVPAKAGSVEPAVATVAESEKPSTNGTAPTPTSAVVSSSTPAVSPAASAPATPAKNAHAFPSSETESVSSSTNNSPSKFGTVGSRQIRQSIFGKFKGLFHSDKEEKKKKK
ncbi:hypothetical protein B0H19DRAFT_340147 [Mycena capillaripes]|nr:hypothetical protein B0H19DRAFT_340147 [Mycena capillaripes]